MTMARAGDVGRATTPTPHSQPAAAAPKPLAATLGAGRGLRRRLLVHHLPIAGASASGLGALIAVAPSHTTVALRQLTSPTGDIALALLGLTLLIGPANLVLRRRMPVNSYLRRDVGTWAAIWSVAHVIVGF
jgi:hypothetical protein